jgi:hypothetical protein
LVTTEDCAQADSDAAPRLTANNLITFRVSVETRGAQTDTRSAPLSIGELLIQPMKDMLFPPSRYGKVRQGMRAKP